jgi:DNA-binding GntR family transcriptional regulator
MVCLSFKQLTRHDRIVVVARRMTARQIADDMEERIRSGEYPPGTRLPTTLELANLYRVGTTTASSVYLMLRERGLTEGMQGVGIFVREDAGL